MAGSRNDDINGATYSPRASGRPIPKRGQVKLGIMVGLAHSVASIFSPTTRRTQNSTAVTGSQIPARPVLSSYELVEEKGQGELFWFLFFVKIINGKWRFCSLFMILLSQAQADIFFQLYSTFLYPKSFTLKRIYLISLIFKFCDQAKTMEIIHTVNSFEFDMNMMCQFFENFKDKDKTVGN